MSLVYHERRPLLHFAVMPTVFICTIATRSLATLAPLPALLGVQFCFVPLQLGSTDHHGVLQSSV